MWVANGSGEVVENLHMMQCHGLLASLVVSLAFSPLIVFSRLPLVCAVFMASGLLVVLTASIAFMGLWGGVVAHSCLVGAFGQWVSSKRVVLMASINYTGVLGALLLLLVWLEFLAVGFLPGDVAHVFLPIRLNGFPLHLPLPTCDGAWVRWGAFASQSQS